MAFKLSVAPSADIDFESIIEFYLEKDADYPRRIYNAFLSKTNNLMMYPEMGRVVPEFSAQKMTKYRELIIDHFRFIYRFDKHEIIFVRILDSRKLFDMDWLV